MSIQLFFQVSSFKRKKNKQLIRLQFGVFLFEKLWKILILIVWWHQNKSLLWQMKKYRIIPKNEMRWLKCGDLCASFFSTMFSITKPSKISSSPYFIIESRKFRLIKFDGTLWYNWKNEIKANPFQCRLQSFM